MGALTCWPWRTGTGRERPVATAVRLAACLGGPRACPRVPPHRTIGRAGWGGPGAAGRPRQGAHPRVRRRPGYILLLAAVVVAAWVGGVLGGLVSLATAALLHGLLTLVDPLGWPAAVGSADLFKERLLRRRRRCWSSCSSGHDARRATAWRTRSGKTAALAEALEARDQRLELVLAARQAPGRGSGTWPAVELHWSEAIYRQHGLDPTGAGSGLRGLPARSIHPDDRERFGESHRAGRRAGRTVRPRVPRPLARRQRPLEPRGRARLPRQRRGGRHAWWARARTSRSIGVSRSSATDCSRRNAAPTSSARPSSTSSATSCVRPSRPSSA